MLASAHFLLRLSPTGVKRNPAETLPPAFPEKTEPLLFNPTNFTGAKARENIHLIFLNPDSIWVFHGKSARFFRFGA